MGAREELIKATEYFYIDIIEGYKQVEQEVIRQSQFLKMFKKPNYDARVEGFRKYKKLALDMDLKTIQVDADDEAGEELKQKLDRCLACFNALCDAYITFQTQLKNKAEGKEKVKMSTYKETSEKLRRCNVSMMQALHNLDIVYTDYTEDEDKYNFED